ncbi:MAG: ribonuclease Z [Candidatus Aminicenantes bacterium]|nr:ribonuclease Z [Candidatus Aminicenantes bacterium]
MFLGTGGSVATPERDNTAFLLRDARSTVLVDCPGSVVQKLRKIKVDPRRVSAVLLTHIHPDHVYGWPSFIHCLMLEEGEVRLYGSAESVDLARRLLDLFRLREKSVRTKVRFKPLEPGREQAVGEGLTVMPIRIPHHASSLAYHFYFKSEGKEVILSGDTPLHPPLFEEARRAACLVHDCSAPSRVFRQYPELRRMHTNSLDLGKQGQEAEVECLVPVHFLGEVRFSRTEIEREIRKHFRGRLLIPEDLMALKL